MSATSWPPTAMPWLNVAKAVQENVTSAVESMTGIQVTEVNVNVCGITVEHK